MYQIGRFAVIGEHEAEPDGLIPIRILPHLHFRAYAWWSESTAQMLERLDEVEGKTVCDFGCGASAILAIAAARLGAAVTAVEQNAELAELARANLDANGFQAVPLMVGDFSDAEAHFDLLIANVGDAHLVGQVSKQSEHGWGTEQDGVVISW